MNEFRALIVDDEPPSRRVIRQLARCHPDLVIVAEARDVGEALEALDQRQFDLVFLDIELPGPSGIDLIRSRGTDRMPPVVFVTAHDEFAVQAFELAALDYLMKPVSQSRFDVTMQRLRRIRTRGEAGSAADGIQVLVDLYDARADRPGRAKPFVRRLRVRVGTRDLVIATDEVCYLAAHGVYARLQTRTSSHLLRETMHWIEARLDPSVFVRTHRSFIVNADHVRELRTEPNGDRVVVMKAGQVLPISRRRRAGAERILLGR